ncbi:MAG: PQQ-binding-like beta-propeller repeat protein [Chloroflexota bacterium]|nr:PQQ-binding-like beta-propeller repeat protein [Chloroflexota bacterium]
MYALPAGSSNATWQFPPADKNTYPVSESAQRALNAQIDSTGLPDADKTSLKAKVGDLHVAGPSIKVLKDAATAAVADTSARSRLNSQVDAVTKVESNALGKIQAVYGDIGISTDKKTAYFGTFKGFLFAIDISTGHLRWLRDEAGDGIVGGIAVDDGTLYYGTKGKHVFALDAETGGQKWVATTKGEVWATPVLAADSLYVTSLDGSLYALDKSSGSQNWRFDGAGSGVAAKPLVSGDSVYVGAFDDKLYSVKVDDGSMNWSLKAGNWFWATPVLSGGIIYAASLDGKVYAVDASTGASRWDKPFDTGAAVRSTPVVAGGGLIAAARDGKVFKLDLATGKQSDASPVVIANTKILADLTTDTAGKIVYIVPDSATLFTIDAANLGPPGSVPLPQ